MLRPSHIPFLLLLICLLCLSDCPGIDLEKHPGKSIYQKLCVDCHGTKGEGNPKKDIDPLTGDRSLESLAGRIERTMPEDDEDACVGPDAKSVAEYIYHAFYSPAAQLRNNQVRNRLSRLTAVQYQNSVLDIFAYFRNNKWPAEVENPGLAAVYLPKASSGVNRSADMKESQKRVDPQIAFDFGDQLPDLPDVSKFKPEEFGIIWQGGIFVRHTGVYEFTIRTRNGAYLNINEPDENRGKLIDAWVTPNNEIREESAKIFLVGGRTYPVDFHFFKYREDKALIELYWKPPHGIRELVPQDVFTTKKQPRVFIPTASFPADDRSLGYETGQSVSRAWLDAITSGGLEAASHAADFLDELAAVKKDDPPELRQQKVESFAGDFAGIAFRRQISEAERTAILGDAFAEPEGDWKKSIRQVVLRVLTAPEFLYPNAVVARQHDSWSSAHALATTLWDSIPDKVLRLSAAKGELDTAQRLTRRAERMLDDSRTRHKLDGFFRHWLELERSYDLAKDKELYPDFNSALVSDLRTSLEMFLDEVVWSDASDYRRLFLFDEIYTNDRIAKVYSQTVKENRFDKVVYPNESRSGIITHPLILTAHAYHNNSSPVHRGVFLSRNIAGLPLKPPKEAIVFDDKQFDPSLTMREKVTQMTESKSCMACHASINPLGFSLEHFDAIGRWRDLDAGKKVDDDAELLLDSGERFQFKNPRDLARFAAESPSAHRAFIRQLFHHLVKQPIEAYGLHTGQELYDDFTQSGFNIKQLMVRIAVVSALQKPAKES